MRRIALTLFAMIALTFACVQRDDQALAANIEDAVRKNALNPGYIFDFAEIAPYQWDTLHVVGPYSTVEMIRSATGLANLDGIETSIGSRDDIALLLFALDGRVVRYAEISRTIADFSISRSVQRKSAKFRLDRSSALANVAWIEVE